MMNGRAQSRVKTIVIIGASGFIGEHLLSVISARTDIEIRVLVHHNKASYHDNISFIEGDLLAPKSLGALLRENCTVINLAYLAQSNVNAIDNLTNACAENKVARLIHCSTAVVVGRARNKWVTEDISCMPHSEYEQTKLQMELTLLEKAIGKFDVTILRPTAVFGPKGKNLFKLANELMLENMWINYLRSCLFSQRSMNLVCVENVVAALIFLIDATNVDQEVFIISDDNSLTNNYRDIEDRLLAKFGKTYSVPRLYIPKIILSILLRLTGKSNVNPSVKYSDRKLATLGFKKPQSLEIAVDNFAEWFKTSVEPKA